jgi:hypothetical protein
MKLKFKTKRREDGVGALGDERERVWLESPFDTGSDGKAFEKQWRVAGDEWLERKKQWRFAQLPRKGVPRRRAGRRAQLKESTAIMTTASAGKTTMCGAR